MVIASATALDATGDVTGFIEADCVITSTTTLSSTLDRQAEGAALIQDNTTLLGGLSVTRQASTLIQSSTTLIAFTIFQAPDQPELIGFAPQHAALVGRAPQDIKLLGRVRGPPAA